MKKLSPKQVRAAILIGYGSSKITAANDKSVKVSPPTISEWMHNPEFVALINRSKRALMEETQDMLRGNLADAVESIRTLLTGAKNEKVRLEAAKFIIESAGIIPPEIGLWDTGPQTAKEVEIEQIKADNPALASLIPDHYL